jgi:sugar phosphate isomerase/epimerase
MLTGGLVSITFRKLSPAEIAALVQRAGLSAIEWGGDIHAPHGDVARAREVARLTADHGLRTCAYGSYYRVGESEAKGLAFAAVLDSAVALGAPVIRVWAGARGSVDADAAYRAAVVADSRRIADLAQAAGVQVAYEYHGNTLTDSDAAAQRLLAEAAHPALLTFWQPHVGRPADEAEAGLRAILPRLANLHVFSWRAHERLPLAERAADWRQWLAVARGSGRDHVCTLEFVKDDSPERFLEDARTLREWLG